MVWSTDKESAGAVSAMLAALEAHHPPTHRHCVRVGYLARALGTRLGVADAALDTLADAGALHDIGKLTIPASLLSLEGVLTPSGARTFRSSFAHGCRLVESARHLDDAARIVAASRERYDGSGYPKGIAGAAIPLGARIVAVADAFDAMTRREWGPPCLAIQAALRELAAHAGRQFDPALVDALRFVLPPEVRTRAAGQPGAPPFGPGTHLPDHPLGPAA